MDDSVIALLRRKVAEYKEEISIYLTTGRVETLESYNRLVGRYEGVSMLEEDLADIEKRLIEE